MVCSFLSLNFQYFPEYSALGFISLELVQQTGSLILMPALRAPFLLLGFLIQTLDDEFCFILYFILSCFLLEAKSFLITGR